MNAKVAFINASTTIIHNITIGLEGYSWQFYANRYSQLLIEIKLNRTFAPIFDYMKSVYQLTPLLQIATVRHGVDLDLLLLTLLLSFLIIGTEVIKKRLPSIFQNYQKDFTINKDSQPNFKSSDENPPNVFPINYHYQSLASYHEHRSYLESIKSRTDEDIKHVGFIEQILISSQNHLYWIFKDKITLFLIIIAIVWWTNFPTAPTLKIFSSSSEWSVIEFTSALILSILTKEMFGTRLTRFLFLFLALYLVEVSLQTKKQQNAILMELSQPISRYAYYLGWFFAHFIVLTVFISGTVFIQVLFQSFRFGIIPYFPFLILLGLFIIAVVWNYLLMGLVSYIIAARLQNSNKLIRPFLIGVILFIVFPEFLYQFFSTIKNQELISFFVTTKVFDILSFLFFKNILSVESEYETYFFSLYPLYLRHGLKALKLINAPLTLSYPFSTIPYEHDFKTVFTAAGLLWGNILPLYIAFVFLTLLILYSTKYVEP